MCREQRLVPIPAFLGVECIPDDSTEYGIDAEGRECFLLDVCIIPVVEAIWALGIKTRGCCCGHGIRFGAVTVETALAPAAVDGAPETEDA